MVGELEGGEERGGVEFVEHGFPQRGRRVEEEHAGIEKPVGWFAVGVGRVRDGCWGLERGRVRNGRVCAVFGVPVFGGPGVVVEVADAGVVGADPVAGGEGDVEDFVHVLEDGDVRVEEDEGVVVD